MALFTMADTHLSFAHPKPMDIFGGRWQDHPNKIADRWRAVVTDRDTVLVGGDISWGISLEEALPDLRFIDEQPGKKIFLRGNHDYWWSTLQKNRAFLEANGLTTIDFLQNNAFSCDGFVICGTRGWYNDPDTAPAETDYKKIVAREAGRLKLSLQAAANMEGEKLVFFHFPPYFGSYVCRELIDILHEYGITRCYYGHIHGQYRVPPYSDFEGIRFTLVASDYLGFTPYLIAPSNIS